MNKLYMKIHGFEEQSHSLLVSFASDTTKSSDPEMYPHYAFQPMKMWPDVTDPTEILKRIAVSGVYHAEQQVIEEKFVADQTKVDTYKAMVGQSEEYLVSELIPPAPNYDIYVFGEPI